METKSWMTCNKLKLNEEKTEFLVIHVGSHYNLKNLTETVLKIGNIYKPSTSARNLGAYFDCNMTMLPLYMYI